MCRFRDVGGPWTVAWKADNDPLYRLARLAAATKTRGSDRKRSTRIDDAIDKVQKTAIQ